MNGERFGMRRQRTGVAECALKLLGSDKIIGATVDEGLDMILTLSVVSSLAKTVESSQKTFGMGTMSTYKKRKKQLTYRNDDPSQHTAYSIQIFLMVSHGTTGSGSAGACQYDLFKYTYVRFVTYSRFAL